MAKVHLRLILSFLFTKNRRRIVYLLFPLISMQLVVCAHVDSLTYYVICIFSFFACSDSIAAKNSDLLFDISKFYYLPFSAFQIHGNYFLYRLFHSMIFALIPTILIFIFISWLIEGALFSQTYLAITMQIAPLIIMWPSYIILTHPFIILMLRFNLFANLFSIFCVPFYLSLSITQIFYFKPELFDNGYFNTVLLTIISLILISSVISFYKMVKNEIIFPLNLPSQNGL